MFTLEPGEYSSGTLRDEDILEMFASIAIKAIAAGSDIGKRMLVDIVANSEKLDADNGSELYWEFLYSAANSLCPEGYYFGSHSGDGASFGVWPVNIIG